MVLNDGALTHFSTHKTFTNVDLSFCSTVLATKCQWKILSDLYGSDHYPIITKIAFGNNYKELIKPKPKFKLVAAN